MWAVFLGEQPERRSFSESTQGVRSSNGHVYQRLNTETSAREWRQHSKQLRDRWKRGIKRMFQMEFSFVDEEPEIMATLESARLQNLRFDVIAAMIADRNQPTWITSRKICAEMAVTIKQLQTPVAPFQRRKTQTKLNDLMKALRQLQRTLVSEARSMRDGLDLDGRQFKFVFGEVRRLFEEALRDAGVDGPQAQNVMCRFDDLRGASDGALRREMSRITETAPAQRDAAALTERCSHGLY